MKTSVLPSKKPHRHTVIAYVKQYAYTSETDSSAATRSKTNLDRAKEIADKQLSR